MNQTSDISQLLEQVPFPAFTVESGIITEVNISAIQRQITTGMEVLPFLENGQQEYSTFKGGRLFLAMRVQGILYHASVIRTDERDIFYLESDYINPEMRAFAVASHGLRDPLSDAMLQADMIANDAEQLPDDVKQQLLAIRRSLHKIHRTVCNMSDAVNNRNGLMSKIENANLCATINEIMEKAQTYLCKAGHTLQYTPSTKTVYLMINRDMLERAILNLISNAFKYGCENQPVHAALETGKGYIRFSITNKVDFPEQIMCGNNFSNYLWEPAAKSSYAGVGLGITMARNAATAHEGTLLMDQPQKDTVRFTLSFPITKKNLHPLRSAVVYPIDYAGGYDHTLTELSDILPAELFQ